MPFMMKHVLLVVAFLGIVASLGSALMFMLRRGNPAEPADPARAGRMMRALAVRVGLSVMLFIGVLIAWKLGYIGPSGIPPGA